MSVVLSTLIVNLLSPVGNSASLKSMVCGTSADSDLAGMVIGSVPDTSFTATDVTASLASAALAASMSFASETIPPLTASNFNVTAYKLLRTGS